MESSKPHPCQNQSYVLIKKKHVPILNENCHPLCGGKCIKAQDPSKCYSWCSPKAARDNQVFVENLEEIPSPKVHDPATGNIPFTKSHVGAYEAEHFLGDSRLMSTLLMAIRNPSADLSGRSAGASTNTSKKKKKCASPKNIITCLCPNATKWSDQANNCTSLDPEEPHSHSLSSSWGTIVAVVLCSLLLVLLAYFVYRRLRKASTQSQPITLPDPSHAPGYAPPVELK